MFKLLLAQNTKIIKNNLRYFAAASQNADKPPDIKFETVFRFPLIKYISLLNRLKVYQIFGSAVVVPSCTIMEVLNVLPTQSSLTAIYIAVTGTTLLTLASLPFRNTIGLLYISEDNKFIKISSMDFWGRRKDKVVQVDDWVPLMDMAPKTMDAVYLTPHLADGSKYKLFLKFGQILNSSKMGQVLE